jgi:hypothetical protein
VTENVIWFQGLRIDVGLFSPPLLGSRAIRANLTLKDSAKRVSFAFGKQTGRFRLNQTPPPALSTRRDGAALQGRVSTTRNRRSSPRLKHRFSWSRKNDSNRVKATHQPTNSHTKQTTKKQLQTDNNDFNLLRYKDIFHRIQSAFGR